MGYRFKEEYWNSGYGYEAAKATIDYGFKNLKLKRIVATVLPENIASWKIMEKCGMKLIGDFVDNDNWLVKKYEIVNGQLLIVKITSKTYNKKPKT